jgi:NAD(P)-dependent dehydrogenase (short-subunit alcohol dehydrogenase family)
MIDLTDRVVLVTGGANGLGRAIVERFLAGGARVAVFDRSRSGLLALEEAHPEVLIVHGDVTRYADNARAVAAAVERFGRLDVFIGNAGIYDDRATLESIPGEELGDAFDELFGVDVKGYMLGARAAAAELRRARGAIVFTSSVSGVAPGFGGVLYIAAKHAIVGLTKQLALELAPEIRVNAVAPGFIPTQLGGISALGQAPQSDALPDAERYLLKRVPSAEDYVELYAFFASNSSATLTGSIVLADGGSSIKR